ncbi:hypothetical protein KIH23_02430 [Flavobacterium sp. CYK-55]|uniref:hypothetical protein n=1 Tax=Flavobacterium sp. CYK-55 TaxID=2835529 RepID=UPI001BCBA988|nr:hypothetical protein [Flavobacterium sp. CYK-55]MBS7786141.1 hypothetical protein [Flavobacterium sp. CYK-55]
MRQFVIKISFLIGLFLIAALAVEVFLRQVPNNYTLKQKSIEKQKNQIEVLLFGDSHCLYGLNPKYFSQPTFNLSNVSQTIYFDQLLFNQYVNRLPKLKQVVFCIEYTNLSQLDNTGDDGWRKFLYARFMHVDVPSINPFDPRNYLLTLTQSPYKTRDLIKRYIKKRTILDCDLNGWGNNYLQKDRIPAEQVASKRAKIQEDGLTDFTINARRIQEMINLCKQKGIKVLIVSMPQTRVYERYLNPKKLNKIIQTCTSFEQKNPGVAYYLNLFADKRFNDEDFYDADHLNDQGAVKSSEIVNNFLQRISK